ncbi:hypothetical protein AB0M12_15755 [Nocardia vinacea]|uniref:hypothetical protein n=1 Tax=Nocardia vinacea TaxID=96468 RepID=UPI003425D984
MSLPEGDAEVAAGNVCGAEIGGVDEWMPSYGSGLRVGVPLVQSSASSTARSWMRPAVPRVHML